MHAPVVPLERPSFKVEGDALRLLNIDGLHIVTIPVTDRFGMIVERWRSVERSPLLRHIDMNDFALVRVVDGAEVQREAVLVVVGMRAIVPIARSAASQIQRRCKELEEWRRGLQRC